MCRLCVVSFRLSGSSDPRQGRLELFYNGTWGTVCASFSYSETSVACYSLGFGYEITTLYIVFRLQLHSTRPTTTILLLQSFVYI